MILLSIQPWHVIFSVRQSLQILLRLSFARLLISNWFNSFFSLQIRHRLSIGGCCNSMLSCRKIVILVLWVILGLDRILVYYSVQQHTTLGTKSNNLLPYRRIYTGIKEQYRWFSWYIRTAWVQDRQKIITGYRLLLAANHSIFLCVCLYQINRPLTELGHPHQYSAQGSDSQSEIRLIIKTPNGDSFSVLNRAPDKKDTDLVFAVYHDKNTPNPDSS